MSHDSGPEISERKLLLASASRLPLQPCAAGHFVQGASQVYPGTQAVLNVGGHGKYGNIRELLDAPEAGARSGHGVHTRHRGSC